MQKTLQKLTIIALLAGLSLAVSACQKKPQTNQNTNQPVNQNQNTNTATTTEEIDTSDWQTYRNEKLGISFEYDAIDQNSGYRHLVRRDGNIININHEKTNISFFSIEVLDIFNYDPADFIRDNYMQDVDPACRIDIIKYGQDGPSLKEDYREMYISSYNSDLGATKSIYETDCGPRGNIPTVAYFLYNSEVPDKLIWVILSQDNSLENLSRTFSSITIF